MIVSYGDALYRAVDAVEKLKRDGINVGLVNKVHLNAVDEAMMARLGAAKFVLIVEPLNKKTGPHAHGHPRAHAHADMRARSRSRIRMHMRAHGHACMHTRVLARAHTHTHGHTHARAHTHTHTHARGQAGLGSRFGTLLLERGYHPKFAVLAPHREGCGGLWEHVYHQVALLQRNPQQLLVARNMPTCHAQRAIRNMQRATRNA
jgi:hypothetical protein